MCSLGHGRGATNPAGVAPATQKRHRRRSRTFRKPPSPDPRSATSQNHLPREAGSNAANDVLATFAVQLRPSSKPLTLFFFLRLFTGAGCDSQSLYNSPVRAHCPSLPSAALGLHRTLSPRRLPLGEALDAKSRCRPEERWCTARARASSSSSSSSSTVRERNTMRERNRFRRWGSGAQKKNVRVFGSGAKE